MRKSVKKVTRATTPRKHSRKPVTVPVSMAERDRALEHAFLAIEAQLAPTSISSLQVDGVAMRALPLQGRHAPSWLVRTHGLGRALGCELALRVRRGPEATPPEWATTLLARVARLEVAFGEGQIVKTAGFFPADSELDAVALVLDPTYQAVRTPHDSVPVLLAVGITKDEARLVREWSPRALIEIVAQLDPTLSTVVDRPSLLASPRARSAIERRVDQEGSSMGLLSARVSTATGSERVSWKLDVDSADAVVSLLKGRIGHQRSFIVKSTSHEVELAPGDHPDLALDGTRAQLKLTQPFARSMRATLRATPGTYVFPELPRLTIEVVA